MVSRTLLGIALLALVACGAKSDSGSTTPTTTPTTDKPTTDEPTTDKPTTDKPATDKPTTVATPDPAALAAQVKAGEKAFDESCSGKLDAPSAANIVLNE